MEEKKNQLLEWNIKKKKKVEKRQGENKPRVARADIYSSSFCQNPSLSLLDLQK